MWIPVDKRARAVTKQALRGRVWPQMARRREAASAHDVGADRASQGVAGVSQAAANSSLRAPV
jgi:hypothetical protein